jgi:hypothetical protein
MLGFFCATAGAAAMAASASKVVAGRLTRFQNFIYHSFRYTVSHSPLFKDSGG